MNETLTKENLLQIKTAMNMISRIDRSSYFNNYYSEVISRLDRIDRTAKMEEEPPLKKGIPLNSPTEPTN